VETSCWLCGKAFALLFHYVESAWHNSDILHPGRMYSKG